MFLTQTLKITQKQTLTPQLRTLLSLLKLPLMELKEKIEEEINLNPLTEKKETPSFYYTKSTYPNYSKDEPDTFSLYNSLLFQIKTSFINQPGKNIALHLLNNLNERGFLEKSLEKIAEELALDINLIKKTHQQFLQLDPIGIGSLNLKEFLLLQLEKLNKKESLLFLILTQYSNDFFHGRLCNIAKKLHLSTGYLISSISETLKKLNFTPLVQQTKQNPTILPDISISYHHNWSITINDDLLPSFTIQTQHSKIKNLSKEEKTFIQKNIQNAHLLKQALKIRKINLIRLTKEIIKEQHEFLLNNNGIKPLSRQKVAQKLNISLSTISRLIANKYISSPQGTLPISIFFQTKPKTSQKKTLMLLKKTIEKENRKAPLSDSALQEKMKAEKIFIAKRTITKYRQLLKIASYNQRKL